MIREADQKEKDSGGRSHGANSVQDFGKTSWRSDGTGEY